MPRDIHLEGPHARYCPGKTEAIEEEWGLKGKRRDKGETRSSMQQVPIEAKCGRVPRSRHSGRRKVGRELLFFST